MTLSSGATPRYVSGLLDALVLLRRARPERSANADEIEQDVAIRPEDGSLFVEDLSA
jgi:hypothetical protein